MSDAPIPLPGRAPAPAAAAPIDPLAGDWSEGLPGPARALAVPEPRRLALEAAARVEAVAAPADWQGATADPLHSTPDPGEHATAQDAPTPWSEPVAQGGGDLAWEAPAAQNDGEEVVWEAPAEPAWTETAASTQPGAALPEAPPAEPASGAGHDAWLAPPPDAEEKAQDAWAAPAEVVEEWQAEAPAADPGSVQAAAALPDAPPPDWSTLKTSGPDWSAPEEEAAPAQGAWEALPPSPAASDWLITPAGPSPEHREAPAAPAWNAPAVGASALEQLDSEPPEPEPGAAQRLFGSVPAGGSLSGDDDAAAAEMLGAAEDGAAAPEVPASEEDLLRPLDPRDDEDLPVALDEAEPAPKPLAALRPATAGALEVVGEHRVAVHTRGGRTLRGTVCDVDLSKPQFALQPQGGGSTETVYHSDVKVIFFMLPPGEKVQAADGGRVRVKLSDGRVIEGERDGAEARHGFFLVPGDAARTNTRRIYVAREAADEIEG
jgi:small nuclear ribonucleoprotein (snRNP)-like protein